MRSRSTHARHDRRKASRKVGLKPRTPQASQGRFDPVHDPGALANQALALAGRAPGIFFLQGRNGGHVAMVRLAPQPAEEHALEQGRVEPVGLGAPMLAGDGNAGRVNDMSFNAVGPKPAR
jgi:hypothetical protein